MHTSEDEIDIKDIFFTLYKYKFFIFSMTVVFALLGAVYAYFQPNIYRATSSVKVGLDRGAMAKDVLSMAMGKGAVTEGTEKDLIQSRYLREKAMQMVDFSHHYYTKKHFKEIELYKHSPFEVIMLKGYGYSFSLTLIDDSHYKLELHDVKRADGSVIQYSQIHRFDEDVITEDFQLIVMKKSPFHAKEYRFVIDRTSHATGAVFAQQSSEHSTIFKISYEDTVPLRAQEFANALAQAYIEQNVENKNREAVQKLMFIKKQIKKVKKEIHASVEKLEKFRKEVKSVNIDDRMEVVSSRVDSYEEDLMKLNIKEEMLDSLYKQIKKGSQLETLSLSGIAQGESALLSTMHALQQAVLEKKILREDYTEMHPRVIKIERKIKQLKMIILHTVQNLMHSLDKRKKLLLHSIKVQKKILADLPERERQFKELERSYKMNEKMNTYLLQMKAEAEMIKASTVSKNRILEHAQLPHSPVRPKRKYIIVISALLGFVLSVVSILLIRFLDNKIKTEKEIKQLTNLPIIGIVPHMDRKKKMWDEALQVFNAPKSLFAEAFRNIRSNLHMLDNHSDKKIILLTSTVGEEGKTTLSVNLAGIMSLTQKRTVVINMDMRKPTLHEKFNLPNKEGLSELLLGGIDLHNAIQETKYPYLDMIASGNAEINPAEAILSKKMFEILEELKKGYEIIILDTPPIGLVSDAKILMEYVDINLYVLRANYSKKIYLETLHENVKMHQLTNVGIILNDVNFKEGHYGYYHQYGYYEEDKA